MDLKRKSPRHLPFTMPPSPAPSDRFWTRKFRDAFRGVKEGVQGQSSFFVHFFVTVLVIAAGVVLGVSRKEWCLLALCITVVLTAEMFNSALESMAKAITGESDPHLGNNTASVETTVGESSSADLSVVKECAAEEDQQEFHTPIKHA